MKSLHEWNTELGLDKDDPRVGQIRDEALEHVALLCENILSLRPFARQIRSWKLFREWESSGTKANSKRSVSCENTARCVTCKNTAREVLALKNTLRDLMVLVDELKRTSESSLR